LTLICTSTGTGLPSSIAGLKRYCFTASIAFSSRLIAASRLFSG